MKYRIKKQWCKVIRKYEYMPQVKKLIFWRDLMWLGGGMNEAYAQEIIRRCKEQV